MVSQTASVKGGLRFISEAQKDSARAKMREIVSHNLPQTSAVVNFTDAYPAMGPKPENLELLATLSVAIVAVSIGLRLVGGSMELQTARSGAAAA